MTFGSSYREVRKTEGSRNRDSSVLYRKRFNLRVIFGTTVLFFLSHFGSSSFLTCL